MNTTKFSPGILLIFFLLPLVSIGQNQLPQKKITVVGKADMELTPDEIFLSLSLKEYLDGKRTVTIDKLESTLVKASKKAEIYEKNLTVENIHWYNWNWKKRRSEEFLATKSFKLKLSDLKKVDQLLATLDERGINQVNISHYTHSKLEQYQKELKLLALQNAKEQANFLLKGIGEELGPVLEIQEIMKGRSQPVLYRAEMMQAADAAYQSDVEFKTIKIQSEIEAVFKIQ